MIIKVVASLWAGLGFYRGVQLYNYRYENGYNKTYFYLGCFFKGVFGGLLYITPFLLPLIIIKEIYRLEVEIKGINEEKNHSFYELL
jgi:hypothetical protein